jgi:Na+-translocating ferredoxin:NAD+ oxidoreductase subunit B
MEHVYRQLAKKLDALPNGFPATSDGAELRLLAKLFQPEEAALAILLADRLEPVELIASRAGYSTDPASIKELAALLKAMARKGLIEAGKTENGIGFRLMPFVVGIYEAQIGRIDGELAGLFEDYYRQSFGQALSISPSFHRVIPVKESVLVDMEVRPYENAAQILDQAQSWGVLDCICRTQKALIGQACTHPVDVCMTLGPLPGMFDNHPLIRPLTLEGAHATLKRAASAGLVHTVSNNQQGTWYICNCCTCSCGILRGMAEMGIADAVARSAFVNRVNEELCLVCENCLSYCQFDALVLDNGRIQVIPTRCIGCGVCVPACPEGALGLIRRQEADVLSVPLTQADWGTQRLEYRKNLAGSI